MPVDDPILITRIWGGHKVGMGWRGGGMDLGRVGRIVCGGGGYYQNTLHICMNS